MNDKNHNDDFTLSLILYIIILFILFVFEMPWVEIGSFIIAIILGIYGSIRFRTWLYDRYRITAIDLIREIINPSLNGLNFVIDTTDDLTFSTIYRFHPRYGLPSDDIRLRILSKWHPIIKHKIERFNESCNGINTRIDDVINQALSNSIIRRVLTGVEYELELIDEYERYSESELNELITGLNIQSDIDGINALLINLRRISPELREKLIRLKQKWIRRYRISNDLLR